MEIARLVARNTDPGSENRMHDDSVAATYGFRGGLVPGVTVYGYLADPLGTGFLESGGMKLRLLHPLYEGDEVTIRRTDDHTVLALNQAGEVCVSGTLTSFPRPTLDRFPEAPLPDPRQPAGPAEFKPGRILGTIRRVPTAPDAASLLEFSNRILMQNVVLQPWIHVSSEVQHFSLSASSECLTARGRIRECFDKKGHGFVAYEVVLLGEDRRLIQHVTHTAIYAPAPKL